MTQKLTGSRYKEIILEIFEILENNTLIEVKDYSKSLICEAIAKRIKINKLDSVDLYKLLLGNSLEECRNLAKAILFADKAQLISDIYHSIAMNDAIGIALVNTEDGQFINTNPLFQEFLGYNSEELQQMKLVDLLYFDEKDILTNIIISQRIKNKIKNLQEYTYTHKHVKKDGTLVHATVTIQVPRKNNSKVCLVIIKDVSDVLSNDSEAFVSEEEDVGYCLTDMDYFIIDADQYFNSVLYKFNNNLKGRSILNLLNFSDEVKTLEFLQKQYHEDGEVFDTFITYDAVKGIIDIDLSIQVINKNNKNYILFTLKDVTLIKQKEKVKENEERYRTLFNKSKVGIIVLDLEGNKAIDVNIQAVKLFGQSKEALLVSNMVEQSPEYQPDGELSRTKLSKYLQQCKETQRVEEFEWQFRKTSNNELLDTIVTFSPIKLGDKPVIIMFIYDVTAIKRTQKALEESEKKYKLIANNSQDIITLHDMDGRCIYVSPSIENVFGYRPHEIIFSSLIQHVHPYDKKEFVSLIPRIAANKGKINETIFRFKNKEGRYLTLESVSTAIFDEKTGELKHILTASRNITEKYKAQQKVKSYNKKLKKKNVELEKYINSNMQLESFAYIASHDLKSPLRSIANFTQILSNKYIDKSDEKASLYMNHILKNTKDMSALIEDLLTYSRVGNTEDLIMEDVKLNAVINHLIQQQLYNWNNKVEKVNFEVENIPDILFVNKTRVKQLFQNLISNAAKFRKKEENCTVKIYGKEFKDKWQFTVEDNGIGIKEEFIEKIFVVFKRLHTKSQYEGTGIGLSICKKIVEQHQGEIWVESEFGVGTKFHFTIAKNYKNLG